MTHNLIYFESVETSNEELDSAIKKMIANYIEWMKGIRWLPHDTNYIPYTLNIINLDSKQFKLIVTGFVSVFDYSGAGYSDL